MPYFHNPSQVRRISAPSTGQYEAVVVGAGPAGVTAVGNLLEHGVEPILWVDGAFDGGRINQSYREVPSNTKAKLFIDFATAVAPFRRIVYGHPLRCGADDPAPLLDDARGVKSDQLKSMRRLDPEKGCQLSNAADMTLMLTEGLRRFPGVSSHVGHVAEASLDGDASASHWTIRADTSTGTDSVTAKRLILCTGAFPTDPQLPVALPNLSHLPLDTALSPTKLAELLLPRGPTTVAVVGASHSAVLVLRNLADLALSSKSDLRVKWFTRHSLRYAEYEKDFIALDNTGLKGEAAVWARENLEPETMPGRPTGRCIEKIAYERGAEREVYAEHLPGCDFVVQAIGYRPNRIPTLRDSATGEEITPYFDHDRGWFNQVRNGEMVRLPGLYGAGIAFPERVIDRKYGHEEMNVGFFKFMKAVKKWVVHWRE